MAHDLKVRKDAHATLSSSAGTFSIPPNRFLPPDAQAPSLPPTTRVYHTTTNEHYGANTLHGGQWGYSRAGWSLVKHDRDSVEFGLLDKDGTEGEYLTPVGTKLSHSFEPRVQAFPARSTRQ